VYAYRREWRGICEEAKIYPKIGKFFFNFLSFFSSPYNKTTHANNNNVMFEEEKKKKKKKNKEKLLSLTIGLFL